MPVARQSPTVPCPFCGQLNRIELGRLADDPRCASCRRPLHLDRPVPVPVDFYADWCGPCKVLPRVVDELATPRSGSLLVVKVDTDRSPAVAERFDIRGIPTLIAVRGGKEVHRHVGMTLVEAA